MLNIVAATSATLSAMTPRAALDVAGEVGRLEADDADDDGERDEDRARDEERRLGLVVLLGGLAGASAPCSAAARIVLKVRLMAAASLSIQARPPGPVRAAPGPPS